MLIDMHTHTRVSSPCSGLDPEELVDIARRRGLDAVCITEHGRIHGANVAQELGARLGFPVFRGIESRTALGDMLVYGYYDDIPDRLPLEDLCQMIHAAGGVVLIAHPYRGVRWISFGGLHQPSLQPQGNTWGVDGIEVINGQLDDAANQQARVLATCWRVPGIGGSDAHSAYMVGTAATRFEQPIRTDEELVTALKQGRYEALRLHGTSWLEPHAGA
ncbi:MAG: PHP domain-containing protein [Chloroflexi bacterium]|nr:PHP domain-containing protein [Chloroflexota bacterium]MBU1750111.1 PHP domain-containing protein [Chloroflexota bacterium]